MKIFLRLSILTVLSLPVCFNSKAQDTTNMGTEFWVGYGHHQFMETGNNDQNMVLYMATGSQPATVTITLDSSGPVPSIWWRRTFFIPANTVMASDNIPKGFNNATPSNSDPSFDARLFSDPPPVGSGSVGIFRKKGIHIQSDVPIALYTHIYASVSSGSSMLIPVKAWGYTYTCINSRQNYASNTFSWAFIIAKEDNTVIQVTPSVITRAQNLTGLLPGTPKTITLNKGWIYQIFGANDGADANGNGGTSTTAKELTGTVIKSLSPGKPIGVFSGSSRTYYQAACGTSGGDNDIAQLFPLHVWGKKFITAQTAKSSSDTVLTTSAFRIVISDTTTIVKKNGVILTGLINKSYYTFESNTADYIQADKPVMVAQFMLGGACGGSLGDPEMFYLSPVNSAVKNVKCWRTTKSSISLNYITLIIPTAGLSSLFIDSSSVFNLVYAHPQMPGYSVVMKRWAAAQSQFEVRSDSAFTGITYGLGTVESYVYNIGAKFNPLSGVDSMYPARWIGTISSDWNTEGNWSTRTVPTAEDYVMIPAGTPFSPIVSGGIFSCKALTLSNAASIVINSDAKLNVINSP